MNRDDFKALLVRCVLDNLLTEQQAGDLLRRFDAGETVISPDAAPLTLDEAIQPVTAAHLDRALAALILLLGSPAAAPPASPRLTVAPAPSRTSTAARAISSATPSSSRACSARAGG